MNSASLLAFWRCSARQCPRFADTAMRRIVVPATRYRARRNHRRFRSGLSDVPGRQMRAERRDVDERSGRHAGAPRICAPAKRVRSDDVRKPILVTKGATVTMTFDAPGITLTATGKAMSEGGMGETRDRAQSGFLSPDHGDRHRRRHSARRQRRAANVEPRSQHRAVRTRTKTMTTRHLKQFASLAASLHRAVGVQRRGPHREYRRSRRSWRPSPIRSRSPAISR